LIFNYACPVNIFGKNNLPGDGSILRPGNPFDNFNQKDIGKKVNDTPKKNFYR